MEEQGTLIKRDVLSGIQYLSKFNDLTTGLAGAALASARLDLVFIDPPYHLGYEEKVLNLLAEQQYVGKDTLIILETDIATDPAQLLKAAFFVEKEKKYRKNKHLFIRRK
jgi:16S rRNA (guanine966-N2)-methyltransferase